MKTPLRLSKLIAVAVVVGSALCATSSAVPVPFNLRDTSATAEIESGTITRGGITAFLAPGVQGASGALNQTASGFGVDVRNQGGDVSNHIDAGLGFESIFMTFDVDVIWQSLVLSAFSSGEQAFLTIGLNPQMSLSDTGVGSDLYSFSTNNIVRAGQTVILQHGGGNGFSFDSFTVERWTSTTTGVPDSGVSLLLLGLSVGGLGILKRRVDRCHAAA